jgi:hypothetical protein
MNYVQIRELALDEISDIINNASLNLIKSSTKEMSYNHGYFDGLMRVRDAIELILLKIERDNRTN